MEIRNEQVELTGSRVHYVTAGSGTPLVLLHGMGQSALDWHWVLPVLARRFRVLAPDLPGFGENLRPEVHYSPARFGAFVDGFLDALRIPSAVLVGNSMGGLAALRFALATPERVSGLVLAASAGLGREINLSLRALSLPGVGEWATAWAMLPLGPIQRLWLRTAMQFARPERAPVEWVAEQVRLGQRPGYLWSTLSALRALVDGSGQREVLLERLPELTMPTLIIWGEHDQVVPLTQAREAARRLRRGRLAIIPDCGHLPHVERPHQFARALLHACPDLLETAGAFAWSGGRRPEVAMVNSGSAS